MTAARPVQINRIVRSAGASAALIYLNLKDANVTIASGGELRLAGARPFTGPGQIVFTIERVGGRDYAYEVSRASL